MSAASSSTNPIELQRRRSSVTVCADRSAREESPDSNGDFIKQPTPRYAPTRHWSSLQEHADSVTAVVETPAAGGSTPRPEDRREGFTWESATAKQPAPIYSPQLPTPPSPPPLEEILRTVPKEESKNVADDNLTRSDTLPSRPSSNRFSVSSSFSYAPSRSDTSRSSISGVARGIMRHVPDIKMFTSTDRMSEKSEEESSQAPQEEGAPKRLNRKLSFIMPSASTTKDTSEKPQNLVGVSEESASKPAKLQKGGLKDRRNLGQAEALKLTLPLKLPDLPSRSRGRLYEPNNIARPRNRSPKTPWIRNDPLATEPSIEPKSPPPLSGHGLLPGSEPIQSSQSPKFEHPLPKFRDRYYLSRSRHRGSRSGTGTSEGSLSRTPNGNYMLPPDAHFQNPPADKQIKANGELDELSTRSQRSRRWRFSGPWTSNDLPSSESPGQEPTYRRLSITRMFKPKRAERFSTPTSPGKKPTEKSSWRHKQSIPVHPTSPTDTLANMSVPPTFIPPGLNRVPTPPLYDTNGDLKGKLADFFFDVHGAGAGKKSKPSPGGIWDSDALLMSQFSDITPANSDSDEGPQGPASFTPTPLEINEGKDIPTSVAEQQAGYLAVRPAMPPNSLSAAAKDHWLHIQNEEKKDPIVKEALERAKFEWLIPEHLPNSPICPLSPLYRGPAKGVCLWHATNGDTSTARHSTGGRMAEVWEEAKMVDSPMSDKADVVTGHRRRRLASLTSP